MNPRSPAARLLRLVAAALLIAAPLGAAPWTLDDRSRVTVAFDEDCEGLLVGALHDARSEILLAAYCLTRPRIVQALVSASRRGVAVQVKYDARQARFAPMQTAVGTLKEAGIRCTAIRIRRQGGAMHNKFAVIDGERVLTGSFNFTATASKVNYENLLRIDSRPLAQEYRAQFLALRSR